MLCPSQKGLMNLLHHSPSSLPLALSLLNLINWVQLLHSQQTGSFVSSNIPAPAKFRQPLEVLALLVLQA